MTTHDNDREYLNERDAAIATVTPYWAEGDLVETGERGTDDHDTGRIARVRIDITRHEIVTVAWDSQIRTDVDVDEPGCDLRGITRDERDAIRFASES